MADDEGRSYETGGDKTPPEYLHDQDGDGSRKDDPMLGHPQPLLDIHKGRSIRLQVRVLVPVKDHPNFNFVGKLLGPKGNSLKRLQEDTQTKMAILGRGSMRDKVKEEELRNLADPKYAHLNEELHVEVTAFAPAAEAYARMAHALAEVKRFLVPDYYDDIRQNQLRELALMNGDRKKAKLDTSDSFENNNNNNGYEDNPPTATSNGVTSRLPFMTSRPVASTPRTGPRLTSSNLRNSPSGAVRMAPAVPRPVVRSFVASVCTSVGGGQRVIFRKPANLFSQTNSDGTRMQYLAADENGFGYEEDYADEASEMVAKEFPRLRTTPFVEYDDQLPPDGELYEGNGFVTKDYIADEWASVRSASSVPVGRLKAAHPTTRPILRNNYREHPYLTPRF